MPPPHVILVTIGASAGAILAGALWSQWVDGRQVQQELHMAKASLQELRQLVSHRVQMQTMCAECSKMQQELQTARASVQGLTALVSQTASATSARPPSVACPEGRPPSVVDEIRPRIGGGSLCASSFAARSFTRASVRKAEDDLEGWFLNFEETLLHFNREHPRYFDRDTPRCRTSPFCFDYDTGHSIHRAHMPPVGPECRDPIKWFGTPRTDAAKPYCNSDPALFSGLGCNLISLGSNNDFTAEEYMHEATHCRIHTFDCTTNDTRMPQSIRDRTTYYKVCVGDRDETLGGRRFVTWASLLKLAGMSQPPDYLKMDIEGFEYSVMRSVLRDPSQAPLLPQQIAMEVHLKNGAWGGTRERDGGELAAFMLMMYARGYRLTYVNWETPCKHCIEVLFARIFC